MSKIVWDAIGEHFFETGVDRGVFYTLDSEKKYNNGVAWNGLTGVTESSDGGDVTKLYADNIAYLALSAIENFKATIEAYTFPKEFMECDGTVSVAKGMTIGQQPRKPFGLCYRTMIGNDVDGNEHGYKIHIIYGALAAPSQRDYKTINDSPEANTFSWEVSTTPVAVKNHKPTASVVIDSTLFVTESEKAKLAALEEVLYGRDADGETAAIVPHLPLPDEIAIMLA